MVKILVDYGVESYLKLDVLGVYVEGWKICLLGFCICKGCLFYGLAFNINMDLLLFCNINLCGYVGFEMC